METVGDYLKKEREAKNISLREVSRLTKISEFYLDFLEKDDYEKLPQGPYIKGYISSYARLIGGNADEALKLYASVQKQRDDADELSPKKPKDDGKQGAIPSPIRTITLLLNKKKNQDEHTQHEKPQDNRWQSSTALLIRKMGASFNAIGSSFKKTTASFKSAALSSKQIVAALKTVSSKLKVSGIWLKSAAPSSKTITSSLQSTIDSSKKAILSLPKVTFSSKSISFSLKKAITSLNKLRCLYDKRIWLFGSIALLSSGILILAGFGFYHLFLYQKNPPVLADGQVLQGKGSQTILAADTAEGKGPFLPLEAPVRLESPLPVTSNPTKAVSQPTSGAKDSGAASQSLAKKEDSAVAIPSSLVPSLSERIAPTKATNGPLHDTTGLDRPTPESLSGDLNIKALKATVGSDVKDRMPVGVSNSFAWSTDRVYVWSLIQCKHPPSSIRHIYYFKGEKLSDVHLSVQSSHWRTWSYKSLSDRRYIGPWRVDITSAEGKVFRSLYFEVR
jgi:cytoskeletal protein RodZ